MTLEAGQGPAGGAATAERQEKLYSSPQAVAQRARFRAALAARPGEVGLDVGCGVGHLACELAAEVAPAGRIVALDSSSQMIAAAQERAARERCADRFEVRLGDAAALEFAAASFDFVAGTQVYSFVHDVEKAVTEAARVLRRGGRLAILDTDWDMCIWESADRALTRSVVAGRGAQFAHADLPRKLPRLLRDAGLTLTTVEAVPIIELSYEADSFSAGLIANARDAALQHGVSAADVAAWEADLRGRIAPGDYFFCLNRFIFVASK